MGFILLWPFGVEDRVDVEVAIQLGQGRFRLRAASMSLSFILLLFSLRFLISVNTSNAESFVVIKSPMITAIERHTIPLTLVGIDTALSKRRKRYKNYHTT